MAKPIFIWINNGNGRIDDRDDRSRHDALNDLLNGDGDSRTAIRPRTAGTMGRMTQRSVIVGDTAVILPTVDELMALRSDLAHHNHTCKLVADINCPLMGILDSQPRYNDRTMVHYRLFPMMRLF